MALPAREKWWYDVVSVDSIELNDWTYLLWGDRVKVLDTDEDNHTVKVYARGGTGWIPESALGGEPLLELYFIDVGQGDGILIVTPEGHHLMIDGGHRRAYQQTKKSAADFVDWKFHKDYLTEDQRSDAAKNTVRLDAMIASHADVDHYGGLRDLIDRKIELQEDELETVDITVEAFYHPGLSPQTTGPEELGPKSNDRFVSLLTDRASAQEGIKPNPVNAPKLRGIWRDFIKVVVAQKTKAGDPTPITRLSHKTDFLSGFEAGGDSAVTIQVLAPIEKEENGGPALQDLGNEGENKNAHSVALRLDYGDRRFLLAGDLNDMSQKEIMDHYGPEFGNEWGVDVAKACHHGSHHVDFDFLKGVGALSTVFSSGDANTYDHPRAWVLGAAALSGRVIEDPDLPRLKAPLVYSTEVARSLSLKSVDQLRKYGDPQEYGKPDDGEEISTVSGKVTKSKWRVVLKRDSKSGIDFPPLSATRVLRDVVYGLVNVRSDGKRLLFAVRNEGDCSWAYETMEEAEIQTAYVVEKKKDED